MLFHLILLRLILLRHGEAGSDFQPRSPRVGRMPGFPPVATPPAQWCCGLILPTCSPRSNRQTQVVLSPPLPSPTRHSVSGPWSTPSPAVCPRSVTAPPPPGFCPLGGDNVPHLCPPETVPLFSSLHLPWSACFACLNSLSPLSPPAWSSPTPFLTLFSKDHVCLT